MLKRMKIKNLGWITLSAFALFGAACQQPTTGGNVNLNANSTLNTNINANLSNVNMSNANMSNDLSVIDTKEPDKYQATVKLQFQTNGDSKMATPPIQARVARDGANRWLEMTAPNGEKVIYLEADGKRFLVSPQRKQYGVLDKESLGFEIQSLMMPDQIIDRLKTLKGVQSVGEEKVSGRDAVKYRFDSTTKTQTEAGDVNTESYILIDKETGLPLRSVTQSQAQGSVQGVSGVTLVTELSDIKTEVDPNLFTEPANFKQVEPQQIRSQVNQLFNLAMVVIGQLMKTTQPAATPMMSASPTMTATPNP